MKKTLLIISLFALAICVGCQDEGQVPTEPAPATVWDGDKTPPLPECVVAIDLTQEYLEELWENSGDLPVGYSEECVFHVPVDETFYQHVKLSTYIGRGATVGLYVPAHTLPDTLGETVTIVVSVPAYNASLTKEDGAVVGIYAPNIPGGLVLDTAFAVILPIFPWYEVGDEFSIFHIAREGDDPYTYSYEGLQCWTYEEGDTAFGFPVWVLDGGRPDVGAGSWPSEATGGGGS